MKTVKQKIKSHRHIRYEEDIEELKRRLNATEKKTDNYLQYPLLRIYSARDNLSDICVESDKKWLSIVSNLDPTCNLYGGVRPHWTSFWSIKPNGFHLASFLDENWRGWTGQYQDCQLRYDELPRDVLQAHHNELVKYIKDKFTVWYPCHIYNDFTGDMYRP